MPWEGSQRMVARCAELGRITGWPTSPTGFTTRAVLDLGELGEGGEGEAWRDGSSAISVNLAGRALQGNDQLKQQESKELRKGKAYSSVAKYFLRFNRRQG